MCVWGGWVKWVKGIKRYKLPFIKSWGCTVWWPKLILTAYLCLVTDVNWTYCDHFAINTNKSFSCTLEYYLLQCSETKKPLIVTKKKKAGQHILLDRKGRDLGRSLSFSASVSTAVAGCCSTPGGQGDGLSQLLKTGHSG